MDAEGRCRVTARNFRLLKRGEKMRAGDEFYWETQSLPVDKRWTPLPEKYFGDAWSPNVHQPVRRFAEGGAK